MGYNPNFRGNVATAARSTQTVYTNSTASIIPAATSVSANPEGELVLTDVSNEYTIEPWVGLLPANMAVGASGPVTSDGRVENIPLSLGFSVGDTIWVGTTPGSLTNVKPDLTISGWQEGYFVLFVGVVVQNEFNNSNQDIQLCRQIIGQL